MSMWTYQTSGLVDAEHSVELREVKDSRLSPHLSASAVMGSEYLALMG